MSTSTTPPGTTGEIGRVALTSSCWTAPHYPTPGHQYGSSLGRLSRMMGEEGFSEGEDLNDVLYLRLIALRSRAVGEKREQGELEGSKLAMDIQELLEEAEVTANEEAEAAETCV